MNARSFSRSVFALLFVGLLHPGAATAEDPIDFTLVTLEGKVWKLSDQPAPKFWVIAFLSCDCPMSNTYQPILNDLSKLFGDQGVRFLGINANAEETATQVRQYGREFHPAFPIYRDPQASAARGLHATVNPSVFVLDAQRQVRYAGRIDDRYSGKLKDRGKVQREDLRLALEQVLAGKPVSLPKTEAFGCALPFAEAIRTEAGVTYYRDIEPILQKNCQHCHRPGDVGPMALMNYQQAAKWGADLAEVTGSRAMPPWKPTQHDGRFTNQRSLSDAEIATLARWVKEGKAAGDPRDAQPSPAFTNGWHLGQPDVVLEFSEEMIVGAQGTDLFRCFSLPTNFTEDRSIAAIELQPGNRRVVHHALLFTDAKHSGRRLQETYQKEHAGKSEPDRGPGYSMRMGIGFLPDPKAGMGGWAPGQLPKRLPDGVGILLPQGSDIILQIHYHRTGKEEHDRTRLGLYFSKPPVTQTFQGMPVPGFFRQIPAGAKAYEVSGSITVRKDCALYWVVPHMHMLGKQIGLTMTTPDGATRELIAIADWDYNWQETYLLKEPIAVPKGTTFRVHAIFDNSAENPRNPHSPPQPVRLGEQTTNEMCFVFLGLAAPGKERIGMRLNLFDR
jgi:hypothetical protein